MLVLGQRHRSRVGTNSVELCFAGRRHPLPPCFLLIPKRSHSSVKLSSLQHRSTKFTRSLIAGVSFQGMTAPMYSV